MAAGVSRSGSGGGGGSGSGDRSFARSQTAAATAAHVKRAQNAADQMFFFVEFECVDLQVFGRRLSAFNQSAIEMRT